jgi:hypothetical protein
MDEEPEDKVRALSREAAKALPSGSRHYTAYVGPAHQYDFMAATQFRLLTTLGLREHHRLLDFGCGSLRAGRLLIPYLLPGHYYGLEPNRWLIDDGIASELGHSIVEVKQPTFLHHSDFSATRFGVTFDFIVAQSIFSHTGPGVVASTLADFRLCLAEHGLILATFIPDGKAGRKADQSDRWVYPGSVSYDFAAVETLISNSGLAGRMLPWFHPRQTWFALAHSVDALPSPSDDVHLSGVVLRDPELRP